MKCDDCEFLYVAIPYLTSPYGECACLANDEDLVGIDPKHVEHCTLYKKK